MTLSSMDRSTISSAPVLKRSVTNSSAKKAPNTVARPSSSRKGMTAIFVLSVLGGGNRDLIRQFFCGIADDLLRMSDLRHKHHDHNRYRAAGDSAHLIHLHRR